MTAASAPLEAGFEAAVELVNGFRAADFDACRVQTRPCILRGVQPDSPDRGIANLALGDPAGGGAMFVMGQKANGDWALWFGTQRQTYHALALPALMRVCADGQGVNVRQTADESASSLGLFEDGTTVTAERFVLTQAATVSAPGPRGNGWYAISGAVPGYVRADFLSVLTLPDCQLRNALTR